jgi:hypothetical protein
MGRQNGEEYGKKAGSRKQEDCEINNVRHLKILKTSQSRLKFYHHRIEYSDSNRVLSPEGQVTQNCYHM